MKKDNLIKNIYELIKKKEKQKQEKEIKSNLIKNDSEIDNIDENEIDNIDEIDNIEIDNEYFDDDDQYQSDIDYE